jgi:hypothetical protein
MSDDEMRTEFERWAEARGHSDSALERSETVYFSITIENGWQAWQAAYSAGKLAGAREALEKAAKASCVWCQDNKPISEPLYGRPNEIWHVPFPETPSDLQRVRCGAEAIRALLAERKSEVRPRIYRGIPWIRTGSSAYLWT